MADFTKQKKYYEKLRSELQPILETINKEKSNLVALKKPILNPDTKYGNRILACISHYCNLNRPATEDMTYYESLENMRFEYNEILETNYFINCQYGIDYIFSKKIICMMLGISIDMYMEILNFSYESSIVFRDIEELLIASRQESAENFNRNAQAIDNTLKTKGKYGGFDVEMKQSEKNQNNSTVFNAIVSPIEDIDKHLKKFLKVQPTNVIETKGEEK